jgi:predicted PurR-regulated permease PerM
VPGIPNQVASPATQRPAVVDRPTLPASSRIALVGIFLIMVVASLHLARAIVLPLVLAMLVTLTVAPWVHRLARRGISPAVSAILLVAAMSIVAAGGATLLRAPIADMIAGAPQVTKAVRDRFEILREPFDRISEATRGPIVNSDPGSPGAPAGPITVVGAQPSFLDWLVATLADVGTTIVATLILTPFLLASSETLKLKLVRTFPLLSDKKRSLRVLQDVEQRISRFLGTVTAIYAGVGVLVGIAMAILGMPNPILWGVGAALLSYVPWVGPITGIGLAAAVSLTIHPDPVGALAPPIAYAAIQSLEGTLITPLTVGRRMSLNVVAILLTVALTSWMWGIIGTLIGVPILVVVKAFCDEFPSLAHVGLFISAESEPIDEAETETIDAAEREAIADAEREAVEDADETGAPSAAPRRPLATQPPAIIPADGDLARPRADPVV